MTPHKIFIIIPAGGSSNRLGLPEKKQFLKLHDKTILNWSLDLFLAQPFIDKIIVCLPRDNLNHTSLITHPKVSYVVGGMSRSDSVACGFKALDASDDDLILVHDAARPLLSSELVQNIIAATHLYGAAIPGVPVTDTIKSISAKGSVDKTLNRDALRAIQTPQGFRAELLKKAYVELDYRDARYTDESLLIEALGQPVQIVMGEPENIKITTEFDFLVAEALLQAK